MDAYSLSGSWMPEAASADRQHRMPAMSRASLRAVSALGGALGALPLIPIARTLAIQASGPPFLPGLEMASHDYKSATYAEAAVLLAAVPLAAFVFGRALPDWLERRGARGGAWPGIAFASALAAWRLGARPKLALAAGALLAASALGATLASARGRRVSPRLDAEAAQERNPGASADRRGWLAPGVVLVGILLIGWRLYGTPHGPLDLFENGNALAPAQTSLNGGRPYLDTYPIHGWGADGGADALAFRLAAPSVETFRMRQGAMAALAMGALAVAGWVLFRGWLWSAVAFSIGVVLCPIFSERQLPAFAALAALVAAARGCRPGLWFLGGVFGSLTLFFALDFGLFVLAGGALAAVALALADRSVREGVESAALLAAGAMAGALPFLAALAHAGALAAFFRVSFVEVPASIADVWGRPAGTTAELWRTGSPRDWLAALFSTNPEALPWLLPVLFLGLATTVLLFRAASGRRDALDRGALAATAVAVLSVRGVLGRADAGHLALYGAMAGLPMSWLLYRAAHARRHRAALVLAMAVALWIGLRPAAAARTFWAGLRPAAGLAHDECRRATLRTGRATVPCAQADELEALRRYLDANLRPGETFFDYSNQAALYFLMDRRPPIRFTAAPLYEPEELQREVIAALERERPPMAILPHGEWTDTFDGIANAVRTPLVADYVYANYRIVEVAAGRLVAWRPPSPEPRPSAPPAP
jgi:hypothetical protein